MNASTEDRFDSLNSDDKTTTLTTYVQELGIDRKIVLLAACKETNDHVVSNKALVTIMDGLPKTTTRTPKKQKTMPRVSPASNSKQSTTRRTTQKVLFKDDNEASIRELHDNPTSESDDEYDKDMHTNGKPAAVVHSTNINTSQGTMCLSTADTYKKWDGITIATQLALVTQNVTQTQSAVLQQSPIYSK